MKIWGNTFKSNGKYYVSWDFDIPEQLVSREDDVSRYMDIRQFIRDKWSEEGCSDLILVITDDGADFDYIGYPLMIKNTSE